MKVVALDHGTARTGVAVCDETETHRAPAHGGRSASAPRPGSPRSSTLLEAERPARIVVGLPLSLDGREHGQARAAKAFAARLRTAVDVPVELFDERFTTKLADQRGGTAARDARAAATLLEDYLRTVHGQTT